MEEGDMVKEEEIGVKEGEEEEEDYSKDLQQQSKALDKLTDRHPDGDDQRQLDSTRVQEAMASIAASKQADLNAMRLRDGDFDSQAVVQFEILFGQTEVIIKLLSFGTTPSIWDTQYDSLVGSAKALFYICVRFCQVRVYHDVPSHVFMFKHDMTRYFDHAVLGGVDQRKTELRNLWEQVKDFDEGMFVMKTGITGFYNPAIESNLSGYIHMLGQKMIESTE